MDDKKIARLLNGIYRFFSSRFPQERFTNSNHLINKDGYHFNYLNVNYSFNFSYPDFVLNPQGHNLIFKLKAELPEADKNLEQKLNENRISNAQLDSMSGLTGQKIDVNEKSINISCKLKKIPIEENDIDNLCDQLWAYVIKGIFLAVHKF